MAVAKVESPDLDVLVGRAGDEHGRVGGDVEGHHRQLVPVQGQEELERVRKEYLHRVVQQRHR